MSVFHRLGHFLSTTLILYIQMDPPKGYLKESLSIADLKKKHPLAVKKPKINIQA